MDVVCGRKEVAKGISCSGAKDEFGVNTSGEKDRGNVSWNLTGFRQNKGRSVRIWFRTLLHYSLESTGFS